MHLQSDTKLYLVLHIKYCQQGLVLTLYISIFYGNLIFQIITELGEQRESLLRSKNRLVRTDEELSKTQRALNSIKKNVLTNKLILVLLIVLETAILSGLVYLRFLR